MVNTANILAGVKFSPNGLPDNTFLDKIALVADVTADNVPDVKDNHVKDNSFKDARPTPAMMGIKDKYTGNGNITRKNTPNSNADQTGSVALTICVKLMAPAPKDITPNTCVAAKKNA
jgi:hypothetical protein